MKSNFKRMLELLEDTFAMREDPEQLQVNEKVIEDMQKLHPATVSELNEGAGPCIWVLLIPTSEETMNLFIQDKISEQELFNRTKPGEKYEAIYLCSVSTLPEYQKKGLTKKLSVKAIEAIRKDHAIKALYVWPFTKEGEMLADKLAQTTGLPLNKKANT